MFRFKYVRSLWLLSDQSKHFGVDDSELRSSERPQRLKDAEDAKKERPITTRKQEEKS